MKRSLKKLPKFKSEADERRFWQRHDSTRYVDWSKAESVHFPDLKPTSHAISLRVPSYLLIRIKERANELHIPYQSLMKEYLAEGVFRRKRS
ncbi:MAG: BrnA antitoxin family protein [Candidatus Kerfeldbacteria bacterium]|nr:BrnA antitoxin family protein [Candidatus Kerfeldbacteria bacterium]